MNTAFLNKNTFFNSLSESKKSQILTALKKRPYLSAGRNDTSTIANLHFCLNHTGKMKSLISISTSVVDNVICQNRQKDKKSICAFCFSQSMHDLYDNLHPLLKNNLEVLKSRILDDSEIPVIVSKSGFLRFESFGDLCNMIQAANYLKIARLNPWLNCALWTKNPAFIHAAINSGLAIKPKNLNIVLSSRYVNKVDNVPEKYKYFIDRVFTVYDNAGIKSQNIKINCGALSCATCGKCYKKTNKYFEISEKLK